MTSLKIYCMAINYLNVLDKMPNHIKPFGLGNQIYPSHWMTEKEGENISQLNKFYGEATGIYWIWKNYLEKFDQDDWIGFCQYRRLWLDGMFETKQKGNFSSLYSNLLKNNNKIFKSSQSILVQPTIFTKVNLIQQFDALYGKNILKNCIGFVEEKDRLDFEKYLEGNKLSICNMFITKPDVFNQYCLDMFKLIDKLFIYCKSKKLLNNRNVRLPVFMVERFTSFWFEKYTKVGYLSFARLGDFFFSQTLNKFINPLKLPLTFRSYPTIHKY
jgi:hypothetical protein